MLLAGSLLIVIHPVMLTGRFYEFTIRNIKLDAFEYAIITYDDLLTCDTEVRWYFRLGGTTEQKRLDSWELKPDRFLSWPRKSQDQTLGVLMMPGTRLLLKEGTYRIRAGDSLEFLEVVDRTGTALRSEIRVEKSP